MSIIQRLGSRNFPSGSFLASVITLMSGTAISQAIPIAVSPILTRIYSSTDFGIYALYVSAVSLLSVMCTGRYEIAIMLPEKDEEAADVAITAIGVTAVISLLIAFVVRVGNNFLCDLLGNRDISPWLMLVPVTVLLAGVHQSCNYLLTRQKHYNRLAIGSISQSLATACANLVLGLFPVLGGGLIWGNILGHVVSLGILMTKTRVYYESWSFNWARLVGTISRYRHYPLYAAPAGMLHMFSYQAPVFFLAKFYGVQSAGFFGLMTKVVSSPGTLIGRAISQVFYQRVAESVAKGEDTKGELLALARRLFLMTIAPTLLLVAFSPSLFSLVFGETWRTAGDYAQIVAVAAAVRFIVSPLSLVLPATGNVKLGSLWQISYFLTTTTTLSIAAYFSVSIFLMANTAHDTILYSIYFLVIVKNAGRASQRVS